MVLYDHEDGYNAGYKYCINLTHSKLIIILSQGLELCCIKMPHNITVGVMMGYILHFTQAVTTL